MRESLAETEWQTGIMPAHIAIVIYPPFFHRSPELSYADSFAPDLGMNGSGGASWPLIQFSEGTVACPGKNLALLLTTEMLRAILSRARVRMSGGWRFDAAQLLPATVNHFALRFEVRE